MKLWLGKVLLEGISNKRHAGPPSTFSHNISKVVSSQIGFNNVGLIEISAQKPTVPTPTVMPDLIRHPSIGSTAPCSRSVCAHRSRIRSGMTKSGGGDENWTLCFQPRQVIPVALVSPCRASFGRWFPACAEITVGESKGPGNHRRPAPFHTSNPPHPTASVSAPSPSSTCTVEPSGTSPRRMRSASGSCR